MFQIAWLQCSVSLIVAAKLQAVGVHRTNMKLREMKKTKTRVKLTVWDSSVKVLTARTWKHLAAFTSVFTICQGLIRTTV